VTSTAKAIALIWVGLLMIILGLLGPRLFPNRTADATTCDLTPILTKLDAVIAECDGSGAPKFNIYVTPARRAKATSTVSTQPAQTSILIHNGSTKP
jgi:hypothetical protein